jgi:hypothetical protein
VTAEEGPPKYRPVALWFMLIVGAVVGLAILADWLRKKYG